MKIASVVGARPQFIKAAPVSRELRKRHTEILVHTGQHYDDCMSAIFFKDLAIPEPDYNLGVGSGGHGWQTGTMLIKLEEVLLEERPDLVLVYGDTNSTLAGALAAAKLHIPMAHVEAGLRSFNRRMPEEINRVLTDHISHLLFCPTETAVRNLAAEGIHNGVYNVGDVMYDAVLHNIKVAEAHSDILSRLGMTPKAFLLVTVHRPDNTDQPENLEAIVAALNALTEPVIFPAHPRTRKALRNAGCSLNTNVVLIEPVSYLDMLILEKHARMILTDSGGVQKKAYFFGVPCVTLRSETEWVETVEARWNRLVGADTDRLLKAIHVFTPDGDRPLLFGDGAASPRIVEICSHVASHKP
jgi:UDP-N-acetylglucosamine 2-epimerase